MSDINVRVSFDYTPDEPDPEDSTGMSETEYLELNEKLSELGAENVQAEVIR